MVETQYCISVGSVPQAFYAQITENDAQHDEWVQLLAIDKIKGDLTTPCYSKKLQARVSEGESDGSSWIRGTSILFFTEHLLDAIGDLDEQIDGVLVYSRKLSGAVDDTGAVSRTSTVRLYRSTV